ncbi:LacI family DNA-binding transcriptional regulator [Celerinatantimonas sp. MCCC 1A17872]|uniref:LacI family DNA-binding transcriptional regulator n=1 Tax=Celerinatantimonas sp. MCCC 1A17872 TaxID=3177514 RepID=UPI0038C87E7A
MITMLDVAKKAGVSKSTVSRVLNGNPLVSPEIAKLVYKAITETGYRPNLIARQLATNKTNLIGFVIPKALYDSTYFSKLISDGASYCEKNHFQLLLADGKNTGNDELKAIELLVDMKCQGILAYPLHLTQEQLSSFRQTKNAVPIVMINRHFDDYPCIGFNHEQAGYKVTRCLIAKGHRQIAYLQGFESSPTNQARFSGYLKAMNEAQLSVYKQLVPVGNWNWSMQSGYLAAKQLLSSKQSFTALIGASDNLAIGAMKALFEQGLAIPEDISVASFDNSTLSQFSQPGLTSIKQPAKELLEAALAYLIHGHPLPKEDFDSELVIRDSIKDILLEAVT